jgi:hypothetical protein
MRSMYRPIRSFGLQSYSLHLVLSLTAEHERQRLDWCQTREQWDIEWNLTMVRRRCGEWRNFEFSMVRHIARTEGITVWGVMCYRTRTPLILIQGSI